MLATRRTLPLSVQVITMKHEDSDRGSDEDQTLKVADATSPAIFDDANKPHRMNAILTEASQNDRKVRDDPI